MHLVLRSYILLRGSRFRPKAKAEPCLQFLRAYRLPTECPFGVPQLAKAAAGDKKRAGDWITLVIPTSLGKSILFPLPITELAPFLTRGAEEF